MGRGGAKIVDTHKQPKTKRQVYIIRISVCKSTTVSVPIELPLGESNPRGEETTLGVLPSTSQLTNIPLADGTDETLVFRDTDTRKETQNWRDLLTSMLGSNSHNAGDPQGLCIGEALPPIPERLVARICRWEFMDMAELLPKALVSAKATSQAGPSFIIHRKRLVTDI